MTIHRATLRLRCPHCKRMTTVVAQGEYLGAHYAQRGGRTHCNGGGMSARMVRETQETRP